MPTAGRRRRSARPVFGAVAGFLASKIFQDSVLAEILLPALVLYFSSLAEIVHSAGALRGADLFSAFRFWTMLTTTVCAPFLFSMLQKYSPRRRAARH